MVAIQPKLKTKLKNFLSLLIHLYSSVNVVIYIVLLAQIDTEGNREGAEHKHFPQGRRVVNQDVHGGRVRFEEVRFVDVAGEIVAQLHHGWHPCIFVHLSEFEQHAGDLHCYQPWNIRGQLREFPISFLRNGNSVPLVDQIEVVLQNNTTLLINFHVAPNAIHDFTKTTET